MTEYEITVTEDGKQVDYRKFACANDNLARAAAAEMQTTYPNAEVKVGKVKADAE